MRGKQSILVIVLLVAGALLYRKYLRVQNQMAKGRESMSSPVVVKKTDDRMVDRAHQIVLDSFVGRFKDFKSPEWVRANQISLADFNKKALKLESRLLRLDIGQDRIVLNQKSILNPDLRLPSGVRLTPENGAIAGQLSLQRMASEHPDVVAIYKAMDHDILFNTVYQLSSQRRDQILTAHSGRLVVIVDKKGRQGVQIQIKEK